MARDPFGGMTEGGSDYGYQYQISRRERTVRKAPERFSLAEFGREIVTGFVMGGLSSAAFYGAGRAVEAVKRSVRSGYEGGLNEELINRYTSDGKTYLDVDVLPGETGIKIPRRLSPEEMGFLTKEYGVEFGLVYKQGPGRNGGGGQYWLYSGIENQVKVPIANDSMLIYHTHPKGSVGASLGDRMVMKRLEAIGSPQRSSQIIPIGKDGTVRFNSSGTYTARW